MLILRFYTGFSSPVSVGAARLRSHTELLQRDLLRTRPVKHVEIMTEMAFNGYKFKVFNGISKGSADCRGKLQYFRLTQTVRCCQLSMMSDLFILKLVSIRSTGVGILRGEQQKCPISNWGTGINGKQDFGCLHTCAHHVLAMKRTLGNFLQHQL